MPFKTAFIRQADANTEPSDSNYSAAIPLSGLSRRQFLVTGAAGVAALGVGSLIASCAPASPGKPSALRMTPTPIAPFVYRGHSDAVNSVAWSPDGRRIASASADKTVQVWDAADGSHIYTYRGHSDSVNTVAWSPDGARIASASIEDGTAQVWVAADGGHVLRHSGGFGGVSDFAWSPDGKLIASADSNGVHVWRSADGSPVFAYSEDPEYPGTWLAVAWSPDGKRIASSNLEETGDVFVWDTSHGNQISIYHTQWDLQDLVRSIAWAPDGKRIACAGGLDYTLGNSVQIWDAANGERIAGYTGQLGGVAGVAWAPDGKRIASAGNDTTAQVWDVTQRGSVFTYHGHSKAVTSVAWSPSGQNIATGSADNTVRVWRPQ